MSEELRRIRATGNAEIIVKKSRFIADAYYIESAEQAAEIVADTRKKYYDARHVCYAYSLGDINPRLKFSDDGEPKGTAGKPMLDVVTGSGISDILVVVTRYFGGILLGTGGLVRAYSDAAKAAIEAADVHTLVRCISCMIEIEYSDFDKVRYYLEQQGLKDFKTDYGAKILIEAAIPLSMADEVLSEITQLTSGNAEIEKMEEVLA